MCGGGGASKSLYLGIVTNALSTLESYWEDFRRSGMQKHFSYEGHKYSSNATTMRLLQPYTLACNINMHTLLQYVAFDS